MIVFTKKKSTNESFITRHQNAYPTDYNYMPNYDTCKKKTETLPIYAPTITPESDNKALELENDKLKRFPKLIIMPEKYYKVLDPVSKTTEYKNNLETHSQTFHEIKYEDFLTNKYFVNIVSRDHTTLKNAGGSNSF